MSSIYDYFSETELACNCGQCNKGQGEMSPIFMTKLIDMRANLGFPFNLSSAFRCPYYNNKISSTGLNGPHTTGKAVDINLYGAQALEVLSNANKYGFTGVGIKQTGLYSKRFIHLDNLEENSSRPRPWVWTY